MYREKTISLVIPAYNESRLIKPTLENVPDLFDKVIVVDDVSTDNMAHVVQQCMKADDRIELIQHETNQGPGGGIVTGYKRTLELDYDIAVVCGGDFQMPLEQTPDLLDPIIDGEADYTKGNRFMDRGGQIAKIPGNMPRSRLLGNMIISALTKIASGYFKIADVVEGFTALNRAGLERVNWDKAWKRYGYPMDFLIRVNAYGLRTKDVPRRAIYLEGERQSQIKGARYALRVAPMLLRGFLWRLWTKYVLWDFHPLVLFYVAGIVLLPLGVLFSAYLVYLQIVGVGVTGPRAVLAALLLITGLQFLLFGMLFDMEEGK